MSKQLTPEEILKKHQKIIELYARRYHYLGYQDIYNQVYLFFLEAYQQGRKNPETYASNSIHKFVREENRYRKNNVSYEEEYIDD